jgi:hypothetical protein
VVLGESTVSMAYTAAVGAYGISETLLSVAQCMTHAAYFCGSLATRVQGVHLHCIAAGITHARSVNSGGIQLLTLAGPTRALTADLATWNDGPLSASSVKGTLGQRQQRPAQGQCAAQCHTHSSCRQRHPSVHSSCATHQYKLCHPSVQAVPPISTSCATHQYKLCHPSVQAVPPDSMQWMHSVQPFKA